MSQATVRRLGGEKKFPIGKVVLYIVLIALSAFTLIPFVWMLSASLKELEADGIVVRRQYQEMPVRVEYSLTAHGQALWPILHQLAHWARREPCDDIEPRSDSVPGGGNVPDGASMPGVDSVPDGASTPGADEPKGGRSF